MNKSRKDQTDPHRSLRILSELAENDSVTQRDISKRLGIALGLVNSYIKNLIKKGFITVKSIPPKRYVYYLTPKGFTEKTRLSYHLLSDYTRIYREARENFKKLFSELQADGAKRIVFAGADEVAEIAYITLQEAGINLAGVVDMERIGDKFFRLNIKNIRNIKELSYDYIVIASYLKRDELMRELLSERIDKKDIKPLPF